MATVTVSSRNVERAAEVIAAELRVWGVSVKAAQDALMPAFKLARGAPAGAWPAPADEREYSATAMAYALTRVSREVGLRVEDPIVEPSAVAVARLALAHLAQAK